MKLVIPVSQLAELLNIGSNQLLLRLVKQVHPSWSEPLRVFAVDSFDLWEKDCKFVFPSLTVCPAVGQWLTLRTSTQTDFKAFGRKDLYRLSVKVKNLHSLDGVKVSKWTELFGGGSSLGGCWRSLYKSPVDKWRGDLQ